MLDWIKNNFVVYQGGVVIYADETSQVVCDAEWLSNQLGTNTPPIYDDLIVTDLAVSGNWLQIFDQWKEKGLVN